MPELRLVVLALQDRLAYGSTFEAALRSLFGGEASSLSSESPSSAQPQKTASTTSPAAQSDDLNTLIQGAARDLEDYQRLTAQGKLGEAGQKLEQLKIKLDALSRKQK
jgi:uncharacterized membrane protein (UPF0182 family)